MRALPRDSLFALALICLWTRASAQAIPEGAVGRRSSQGAAGSVILSDEELFGEAAVADTAGLEAAPVVPAAPGQSVQQVPALQAPSAPGPSPSATAPGGPLRLLVARPVSFSYAADRKHAWIAPVIELYLALRLGAAQDVFVAPPDAVSAALAGHHNYAARPVRQEYRDAARRLGATHVVLTEYEVQANGTAKLHVTLAGVGGDERKAAAVFDPANAERSLEQCTAEIAAALGVRGTEIAAGKPGALIGPNGRKAQKLGAALAWEGAGGPAKASHAAQQCREMYRADPGLTLARYAAAVMSAESGAWSGALAEIKGLLAGPYAGDGRLAFEAARYARLAGDLPQARALLGRAPASSAFRPAVALEQAALHESDGRLEEALREYDALLAVEPGNTAALERRVSVLLRLRRTGDEVQEAAREAAAAAQISVSSVLSAAAAGLQAAGDLAAAAEGYLLAARAAPENSEPLVRLAAVYEQQGRRVEAAEVYEGLAAMDPSAHRPLLDRAAGIYLEAGRTAQAVQAYETYLASRDEPEAAVSLARLLFQAGECGRVRQALRRVQEKHYASPGVDSMLAACGRDTVAPRITLRGGAVTLRTGQQWTDPGAEAVDDQDGNVSAFVKTRSTVDIAYPGTYEVVYTASDNAGNTATARRVVTVEGEARPELAALARSNRRRPARIAVGLAAGALAAGALVTGVALDSRIGALQEDYDRSRDYDEVQRLHGDMEAAAQARTVLYAAAGACAAGVAVTVTIPAVRRAKAGRALAMIEVRP